MARELSRTVLAEFKDGRVLVRYDNGEYWVIAPLGRLIPGEKMSMRSAARRVAADQATVHWGLRGATRFYAALQEEDW